MDKSFLFHIGLPKTGSTSIQSALVQFSDALEERGIRLPYDRGLYGKGFPNPTAPRGAPQSDGFDFFVDTRARRAPGPINWQQCVAEFLAAPQGRSFVFSHENLSQAGRRLRRERIAEIGTRAQIGFLVYLRHPLAYLNSYALQIVTGHGPAVPRHQMHPIQLYLKHGFAGLLAPFAELGTVTARNFDVLRAEGRLVADVFSEIGAADLIPALPGIRGRNVTEPRIGLAPVLLALKAQEGWTGPEWHAMRRVLIQAVDRIGDPDGDRAGSGFLPADLVERILQRWQRDRQEIAAGFGLDMPEETDFTPGPDRLGFSDSYAGALIEMAGHSLSEGQKARLEQARALAGCELEAALAARPEPARVIPR